MNSKSKHTYIKTLNYASNVGVTCQMKLRVFLDQSVNCLTLGVGVKKDAPILSNIDPRI